MAKKITLRQCVGCGEMRDKKDFIRVIKTPEGEIVLDATGKKNGRGAYLCKNIDCLVKTRKNKGLDRSFKMAVPTSVYETLEEDFKNIE